MSPNESDWRNDFAVFASQLETVTKMLRPFSWTATAECSATGQDESCVIDFAPLWIPTT